MYHANNKNVAYDCLMNGISLAREKDVSWKLPYSVQHYMASAHSTPLNCSGLEWAEGM